MQSKIVTEATASGSSGKPFRVTRVARMDVRGIALRRLVARALVSTGAKTVEGEGVAVSARSKSVGAEMLRCASIRRAGRRVTNDPVL